MRAIIFLVLFALSPILLLSQLINNYDTCRTHVYYQYVGNALSETHITKGRTVQDNGIINAGFLKTTGSVQALLIKQDINGNIIWQKEYGNSSFDEQFTDWRELPNRQLLVAGIAQNHSTQQSVFFIMLISANGDIIWQKSYTDIVTPDIITNAKIFCNSQTEYFFALETNTAVIYGMTDNLGALKWQRSLTSNTGTKLIAATAHADRLLISTNTIDSSRSVSNFYYINYYSTGQPKTIKYTTKLGGVHQNSDYVIHDYEQYGQYTYFSGIRSVNGAPYELIRVCINQGYIHEGLENIITPGVTLDAASKTAINTYGDVISFTSGRKNDKLNAVQLTGSYQVNTTVIWSTSYRLQDSLVLQGNIKTWDNGYIFFGYKEFSNGNKQIIQLKADSASISPDCVSRQAENFSLVRNPFPKDTVTYSYNSQVALTTLAYTASSANGVVDTSIICKQLKCPPLPFSDSCSDSYQKLYKSYEPNCYSTGIQVVNGRLFVSGMFLPMDYIPEAHTSFIAEVNGNGQIVNQRKLRIGFSSYTQIFKGQDSSLLLYGFTDDSVYHRAVLLIKLDTNLNIIWMKKLRLNNTPQYSSNFTTGQVKQSADGSYFIQYSDGVTFGAARLFLTKLDANGNLLWTKIYRPSYPGPGAVNVIKGIKLEVAGGNVYLMCKNSYNSYAASIVLKISEITGNLLWCKKYSNADDFLDLTGMVYVHNNQLFLGGQIKDNTISLGKNILVKAETNGTITNAIILNNPATNTAPVMQFMQDGSDKIYMNGVFYSTPPFANPYQINVTVNSNFDIITTKKRSSVQGNYYAANTSLAMGPGNQLYETGLYSLGYNSLNLMYLIKFTLNGKVGSCPSDSMILEKITAPAISVTDITCTQSDTSLIISTPVYSAEQFFLATAKLVCASVPGCDSINISGNQNICNKTQPYTFRAIRNNGCTAPLQWLYDNSNIQVLNETDSIITIQFLKAGSLLLKARFTSNCTEYTDSLLIHIAGNTPTLNIGADTILCNGANLVLNAKSGFLSYQWQDGSVDSVFTVTAAGLYHVTVTDSCGTLFSDTIRILPDNLFPFTLGNDTAICKSDTLVLQASTGLSNYTWWPPITISPLGAAAAVYPSTTIRYYVSALKQNGCIAEDSVLINVNTPLSINLGIDTSICVNDTLSLNCGSGFINYIWSTGEFSSSIKIFAAGQYTISATDSNNCISRDSLRLLQLIPLPVSSLPKEAAICNGQPVLLDAGSGFKKYLWSTAQITESIYINTMGTYWVTVSDTFGCQKTDTVVINKQLFAPSNFIYHKDSAICSFDILTITPTQDFSSYLWSNGAVTKSINANTQGIYWLKVTDAYGCTGVDSFALSIKQCSENLYFPNSFTPNNDGLNDIYKPKAFGKLSLYRFVIYNRYGEKVFESHNINEGWNGQYNGTKQETGSFVWQCWYQLSNQAVNYKSGSCLLIR